ncbi:ATP-binding protein [Chitinimonas koreensis]|uniref:ATP-binding protein n=1 Tax=Chitinimonas koreensis TaxID=356302 RepID=UPI00041D2338|nr:winged helix-turn-helix domain-containing protein [Chitinimonas koreensis]QNM95244.1 winged helix-turn-helix domain-containing protein [Chitinimonas koreensis]
MSAPNPGRRQADPDLTYAFGDFMLQSRERQICNGGRTVHLGSRTFDLLVALVERGNRLVTTTVLLEQVWPGLVVGENNVQAHICILRKLLGSAAIETVPGHGYRFVLPVTVRPDAAIDAPGGPAAPGRCFPLLGREDDIAQVRQRVSKHRLVTVTGAGGIGKTRLAQAVAQAVATDFAAGVDWVDLSTLTDPEQLPCRTAAALGIRWTGRHAPESELLRALKDQARLIVLDGAEHLQQHTAALVGLLGAANPRLHFLVTSQARLQRVDEQVFRLAPLPVPGPYVTSDEAMEHGVVALFVSRIRALGCPFTLHAGNLAAVLEICRRLDGLPLALELAAARVPALGLAGLARRLDERFQLLTDGNRGAPPRQQTLTAALAWSYGLLDADAQRIFLRLGSWPGAFGLDDAIALLCDDALDECRLIDILAELVERALIVLDEDDPPSYRLLESPRLFAQRELGRHGEAVAPRSADPYAAAGMPPDAAPFLHVRPALPRPPCRPQPRQGGEQK